MKIGKTLNRKLDVIDTSIWNDMEKMVKQTHAKPLFTDVQGILWIPVHRSHPNSHSIWREFYADIL